MRCCPPLETFGTEPGCLSKLRGGRFCSLKCPQRKWNHHHKNVSSKKLPQGHPVLRKAHTLKRLIDQEVEIESQYSQRQRGAYSPKEFVTVQSLSCAPLFVTPWTIACQAPLSSTISRSLLTLMSIESVMLSNQLTLYHPLSPFAFSVSQHQSLF